MIEGLLKTLLAFDYPTDRHELIVIDDGSDDATVRSSTSSAAATRGCGASTARRARRRQERRAQRARSTVATGEIVVVFDADHKPRADVLRRLVRHFADPASARCRVAASSATRTSRSSRRRSRSTTTRGYLVNEYGRQSLYDLPAYGGVELRGAASCARARSAAGTRRPSPRTPTSRCGSCSSGLRVRYDVTAIDTEESVPTFRRFWRQRYRWARGHQLAWREYRRWVWHAPGAVVRPQDRDHDVPARVPRAGRCARSALRDGRLRAARHPRLGLGHRPDPDRDPPVPRSPARARRRADREPVAAEGRVRASSCSCPRSSSSRSCARSRGSTASLGRPYTWAQDAADRPRPEAHDRAAVRRRARRWRHEPSVGSASSLRLGLTLRGAGRRFCCSSTPGARPRRARHRRHADLGVAGIA